MITINEVEVACNLADERVNEIVINDNVNYPNYNCSDDLVEYDEDNMLVYKSDIQDLFDKWYDFYYNELVK